MSPPIDPGELRDGDLRLTLAAYGPHRVHNVPTYHFRMVHTGTSEELGMINLRVASTPHIELYAGQIGYAVHEPHRGHRYASRSVRLLVSLARSLRLDPLWITCDPDNLASRRSLELAGAELVEVVEVPETCAIRRSGHAQKCRYRLDVACVATTR